MSERWDYKCFGGKDVDLGKQVLKMLHFMPKTLYHQECIFKNKKVPSAIPTANEDKLSLAKEK